MARLSRTRFPGVCRNNISVLVMKSTFIKAFKEVLREQILDKNKVDVEGLGMFEVVHRKQHQKKYENGRVVMVPPADVVEFKSNIRSSNEDR